MVSLLSEFERELEPHIAGHAKEIADFKRSCREKLNGLTWEAIELLGGDEGELNEHAVDLAEKLPFDANGGHEKT